MKSIARSTSTAEAGETTSVNEVGSVSLATLNVNTGILLGGPSMTASGKILSLRGTLAISIMTAGDGPHEAYIMNKSISLTELEEYLEAQGPTGPEDTVNSERASRGRRIRYLGPMTPRGNGTVAVLSMMNFSLSGLRFSAAKDGWQWAVYNRGQQMTTGSVLRVRMTSFVQWAKTTV